MILVTGGTGLVGAHLLIHLAENGEKVRAIYRTIQSVQKTKSLFYHYKKEALYNAIEWLQADIIDVPSLENAFLGIEYVYHCAALISFDPKDEKQLRKTNIEGTANIVNFCIANSIKKLCFVSSTAALGDLNEQENTITEETEWNSEKPHSDYAISKYGAEMEIWRGQQEGLNVVIINPGIIIGPGFWEKGSGMLFTKVSNGLSFYTLGTSGFIAATDVVQIAFQLMKSEIVNDRFILVAQNIIYRDVINTIADSLSVKRPFIYANPFLTSVFWRIDWILSTIFRQKRKLSRAISKSSNSRYLYSNNKIKNTLKYEFLEIHQHIKAISSRRC